MAYQFIHMEGFSRKADSKGRSTSFVFGEACRDPAASVHVSSPLPPVIVYGATVEQVEAQHDAAAGAAMVAVKGGKPRKLRQDQKTLHTVVASHPFSMQEVRSDPTKFREAKEWERRTIDWLRGQYGDDLKSVVRHEDESHFHIHAYIVPVDDTGMRALRHHPGVVAKRSAMAAGPADGENSKALSKRADKAYKQAMREWQDSYHVTVGVPCGLTRLGPQRRRLTRAEWQAEQVQAKSLRTTIERAREVKRKGETMIAATKEQAAAAQAAADAAMKLQAEADSRIVAALRAQDLAVKQQETARRATERAKRDIQSARKLSGFGGTLRGLWDGVRRSTIASRIRKELAPTIDSWLAAVTAADARAAAAESARRDAEIKVKDLRSAAADLGAQRDGLRRRLAIYEPVEESAPAYAPRRR